MWPLFLLIVVGSALCTLAQPQAPAAGTLHSFVAVIAEPRNSYALYLPSSYSPQKHWPLLLVFDPFGRGESGVKLFQASDLPMQPRPVSKPC